MYDYIVVGAGSAGCVLAARLSEDPGMRVLLLEAGPPDDAPEIRVPGYTPLLWQGRYAWGEATTPQRYAGGRRLFWPRGRVVGGSSSINGMVYIRGNARDYDGWRDEYGCAGWGYADLLPYFRRAEDQQRGESAYHGIGGPLRVEDPRHRHPLSEAWLEAAYAAGLARNDDFNGAQQDGAGFYQATQRDGRRWSAADAYLRPARGRANLRVESGARATRLIIEAGRVVGVRYRSGEGMSEARADREVVLACGTVGSPQLLLLSGIGPADQLREHGISVTVDAPRVGAGLQDHPACFVVWRTPSVRNAWEEGTPENLALWQEQGRGPLASHGIEVGGFARSRSGLAAPDLQYGVAAGPPPFPDFGPPTHRVAGMPVAAVNVRSRGAITLESPDPDVAPAIDPGFLSEPEDLETLVAGVRLARELGAQRPLADLVTGEDLPGKGIDDDRALRAWIRRTVQTIFHPTGTCAMGGDAEAVCDPQLRVRGVDGLRVADASIMPATPRGNTNAPTIAVAERAADLIRGATDPQPSSGSHAAATRTSPGRAG